MTGSITALLADDEPLARDALRIRLAREPDIEIVGEARNGEQAVELALTLHPDLLFLDIQMPGKDGFQVIEEIAAEHLPVVVFVTAHDEYAFRAFDVHALDGCVATSGLRRQDGPPLASTVPGPPSCPATIRSNGASSNPPSSSSAFGGTCGMP